MPAMKRGGQVLLLLSACAVVCHLHTDVLRRFHRVTVQRTWKEAQHYCRHRYTDLATIQNVAQNTEARRMLRWSRSWIGLSLSSDWSWSQDVSLQTTFTSWAADQPGSGDCVAVSGPGGWSARDCGLKHQAVCYSAEYDKHILVERLMLWSEAQTYCRSTYTHLSTISSQEDNEQVSSLLQSSTDSTDSTDSADSADSRATWSSRATAPLAWIGLHRRVWVWSDRSSASYRRWAAGQPGARSGCVFVDPSSADWFTATCSTRFYFICYTDVRRSALRWVKVRLRGGSADLNDPAVQDGVLQQLKQKLEDGGISEVKLRWRKQADGKIFHREEEAAPPGVWEEDCNAHQ